MFDTIQALDWSVLRFIQDNLQYGFLSKILIFFSSIGNAGIIWICLGLGLLLKKKHRRLGLLILIGLLCMLVTGNLLLKNFIAKPRPFQVEPSLKLLIAEPSGFSFPSGHAFSSFVSATIIYLHEKRWGLAAFILAFLIAFSRLYLAVHFFSDVMAGALLGIFLGLLVYKLSEKFPETIKEKVR